MKPQLVVEQQITAFVNKYAVYSAQIDGTKGGLVAHAQQKRLALKEKITFYSDEAHTQVTFTLRAEKVLDVHGRYLVEDAAGKLIGSFKKDFGKSLLNSTWHILGDGDQPRFTVSESNQLLAILRRIVGLVPFIGGLLELIVIFFRYHFIFTDTATGQAVGRYQKTTLIRDHYVLEMNPDAYASEDWRVLAALAVGLDALQSR